jgi:hypothetical protein
MKERERGREGVEITHLGVQKCRIQYVVDNFSVALRNSALGHREG